MHRDLVDHGVTGGHEVALLVELPVVGEVALGDDPGDPALMDDRGAVEEVAFDAKRHADDERTAESAAGVDEPAEHLGGAVDDHLEVCLGVCDSDPRDGDRDPCEAVPVRGVECQVPHGALALRGSGVAGCSPAASPRGTSEAAEAEATGRSSTGSTEVPRTSRTTLARPAELSWDQLKTTRSARCCRETSDTRAPTGPLRSSIPVAKGQWVARNSRPSSSRSRCGRSSMRGSVLSVKTCRTMISTSTASKG